MIFQGKEQILAGTTMLDGNSRSPALPQKTIVHKSIKKSRSQKTNRLDFPHGLALAQTKNDARWGKANNKTIPVRQVIHWIPRSAEWRTQAKKCLNDLSNNFLKSY